MPQAITATEFLNTLGVNTHLDFSGTPYTNVTQVEQNLQYLGVLIVRDSAQIPSDVALWEQVAQATGVKFDDLMPEGSPTTMSNALALVPQLAAAGILKYIEGGNEEDSSYSASLGNSLAITAQFQQQVYAMGQQFGLPVINMSFGFGWSTSSTGDYGTVGNLAAFANFANAHTYPQPGETPNQAILQLNSDAELAATGRPVMTTEIGWSISQFSPTTVAQNVVDAAFDGIADGDAGMYFYALYDNSSNDYGLFNANGTPRPAATALHDLTTLLADTGTTAASFAPGSLNYSLSGTTSADNSILIEKSDGTFWIGLWDEGGVTHTVTVNLPVPEATLSVFDPVTGTSSVATATNASSISVSLGADPLLIEVVPSSSTPAPTPPSSIIIPASQTSVTEDVSNTLISATAGNHSVVIDGTGDTVSLTGGTETVTVSLGMNIITTGAGNDSISFSGSGNTINAGGGSNILQDSGSGNDLVLPAAGGGSDTIYGAVFSNGDTLDLRQLLAATNWNGQTSTLSEYLHMTTSGHSANAVLEARDTPTAHWSSVATFEGAGGVSISTLLAHAIT